MRMYGSELQINNSSQVAAIDGVNNGDGTISTHARIWDGTTTGSNIIIARGTTPPPRQSPIGYSKRV